MESLSRTERRSSPLLRITSVNPHEQRKMVFDAIAERAYQIYESRNHEPGHELDDWRRAESEIVRPLNCGFLILDQMIALSTDTASLEGREIEICVEPRHLTICGNPRAGRPIVPPERGASTSKGNPIFYVLDLPVEIEPSRVTASLNGRRLDIDLPKAPTKREVHAGKQAA